MTVLGVLDQSPIREGDTASTAIKETLALARHVEALGYSRYWVAEHHGHPGLAGSSPELLVGQIAAQTEVIRVGSGGVMLAHYSPYKVAENFRLLETLYPGRIDLGVGRAPGGDRLATAALQAGPGAAGGEYFGHQLNDLIDFIGNRLGEDHPLFGLVANPAGPSVPELWLLGSSDQSAALAAHFGKSFSFAHFIIGEGGPQVMSAYRENFRPSAELKQPHGSIGVHVICADTEAAADRLAHSRDLWWQRLEQGRPSPVPSVSEAEDFDFSEQELARIRFNRMRQVIGAPEQVRDKLETLGRDYGVEELMILTVVHDFEARCRSYKLVAEVMDIIPQ
jgi:luciferase family oxidoreductase group 1